MKILKETLLGILLTVLFAPNVFAMEEPYYVNNLGVEMTETEYNTLLAKFDEKFIDNLSQEFFDSAIIDIDNIQLVDQKKVYLETFTFKDRNGQITNSEREITEEEYNNFEKTQSYASCNDGYACWETNAKKLMLDIYVDERTNLYAFRLINLWKSIPNVKSFDVIGFRWTSTGGGLQPGIYEGVQYYNNSFVSYSYGGDNSKTTSSGVGISMNIVDDTSSFLENDLYQYMAFTKLTTFNIFGTYQHATVATTLSESKSYSFSNSGLGKVLYYSNSSIRNKYDGMTGINYSFVPAIYNDPTVILSA